MFVKPRHGCGAEVLTVSDPDRMLQLGLSQNLPHALFILTLISEGEGAEVTLAVVESLDEAAGCIHKLEHRL